MTDRAHLVMRSLQLAVKESSASKEIGTTGRGIGPCDEDKIALCTGYHINGELVTEFSGDIADLEQITPHYEWSEGWMTSTADARTIEALPPQASRYLDQIEALVESLIRHVSVGTRRDQIIGM